MLLSAQFQKKPTDNVSLYEFDKYLKRNKLEGYLPEDDRRLVFEYVDPKNNGTVSVRDFLKRVEEREFYGTEHNREHTKIKDFLEFHITQKRLEQTAKGGGESGGGGGTSPPVKHKKVKGIDNEVERMRQALGMKTYGLDVDPEELDHVVSEVFHKLPTNEAHRRYARYVHHSQLNIAAIPFYDYRSREIERLKNRSTLIDQELGREGLREEYESLKSTFMRGSLAVSQSLPSLHALPRPSSSSSAYPSHHQQQPYHSSDNKMLSQSMSSSSLQVHTLADSNAGASGNGVVSARPSPLAVSQSNNNDTHHVQMPMSPSSHGTFQATKAALPRLEALTHPLPSTLLSTDPSSSAPPANQQSNPTAGAKAPLAAPTATMSPPKQKFNSVKKDREKEAQTRLKSLVLTENIDQHLSKEGAFDAQQQVQLGSGRNSVTSSYLDLLIEQPAYSNDRDDNVSSPDKSSAPHVLKSSSNISAASQKKSVSKLVNKSHATEDHVSDFYSHVISPTQSMGRTKDPNKVMRIEKTDFIATTLGTNNHGVAGKRMLSGPLDDGGRVGLGPRTRYHDHNISGRAPQPDDASSNHLMSSPERPSETFHPQMSQESPQQQRPYHQPWQTATELVYDPDDHYRSVASTQYPPLIYEPSQPVRREGESLAMQEAAKREYRRQERCARKNANMAVTEARLAYNQMNQHLRELARNQTRIEDAIRYKTSIFLGDLQSFRQQPLQRMAKRQNMELADKMFNGNVEKQTVGLVSDSRDFTSTYRASFDSEKLRQSQALSGHEGGSGHE